MAGPSICVLCIADTCTYDVHPYSILLHLMDICFLTYICLWQISQIQTRLFKVVGPRLVSTSPAFVSSSASHPVGPHGWHAKKNGKSGPHCWEREISAQQLVYSTVCRLCRLEPLVMLLMFNKCFMEIIPTIWR